MPTLCTGYVEIEALEREIREEENRLEKRRKEVGVEKVVEEVEI